MTTALFPKGTNAQDIFMYVLESKGVGSRGVGRLVGLQNAETHCKTRGMSVVDGKSVLGFMMGTQCFFLFGREAACNPCLLLAV
jgi:hypothetical protein